MTALKNSSVAVVDQSIKSQSTWYASTLKRLSFLRILTKLSLLWRHPFVTLLVLLLLTPPVQPIVKFFSPLIVLTFLCIVAFKSSGSPLDKIKEGKAHIRIGDEIAAGMDVLRLSEGWAAFMHHGFQPDSMLKPEGDPNSWMQKIKRKTYVQTQNETFVANVLNGSDSNLKGIGLSFLTGQMKDGKALHAKIEDEFAQMDGLERDGTWASLSYDELQPDNTFTQNSLTSLTGPVTESKFQSKNLVKFEDEIAGMDGQGGDGDWSCQMQDGLQSDTDTDQDDVYSFVREEMEENDIPVHIEDPTAAIGLGKERQLYDGFQQEGNLKHESIVDFTMENTNMFKTEIPIEEEIARKDVASKPHHGFQTDSNPKHECSLEQKIDTQVQIEDKIASMGVPADHDQDFGAELCHEFQPYSSQKLQEDDPNPENGLIPQRWRDWVRGVETDGLSIWTSENNLLKNVDEKTLCTNFNQEITGIAAMEEFMCNGAFAAADENGGVLLEELSAFIQELTVKLQSFSGFEADIGQKGIMKDQKDIKIACNMNDPTGLKLVDFSPLVETLDDSNTEQGDESSRWDEALDSEKESLDSENGEGSIWPRASDVSDLGATVTEKEIKSLKPEYVTLDKECKVLQDKDTVKYSEQKTGNWQTAEDAEDSDDSFDPYVRLFAQAASDAEDDGPYLHRHPEHQGLPFPQKVSSLKIKDKSSDTTVRERSSIHTEGLFRKRRLCFICRAIRAFRGKRL
ncbi:hypothetical protein O6H91_05G041700 [Diphasiastrum complanatum]|uniref:Uncharacterized protein n=2 Tax=Diphasiastrum complanatum TaxID=34168 RepID=A0ACC2DML9_DIPCM|nr:hypothetical protein O6H91_05G041700 [Diphasiastrum complanatum]KAJ7555500.1 hypothetical protein O6H91_05G041700 [Diphasiastrum complanatum]